MKWDAKHDRAKKVINRFLDNAGYWQESEDLVEGLSEEDKVQVSEELNLMIASIVKRYKLDVMLPEQAVEETKKVEVEVTETTQEEKTETEPVAEKPKRGRKPAGEKK